MYNYKFDVNEDRWIVYIHELPDPNREPLELIIARCETEELARLVTGALLDQTKGD